MEKDEFGRDIEEKKPVIDEAIRGKLKADFPVEAYSAHPTKTFLTTLKAAYVMERLNDVFGIGRWTIKHKIISKEGDYVLMSGRLYIFDYDCHIPEQYGGHATAGTNTEPADGYKSAITDMLSKSASYLEIGLDMFKGKITGNGSQGQPSGTNAKKTPTQAGIEREVTASEVDVKWNGKIYGKSVFIDNVKVIPPIDQLEKLKGHAKYIPGDKK